jgi:hypothetical protein
MKNTHHIKSYINERDHPYVLCHTSENWKILQVKQEEVCVRARAHTHTHTQNRFTGEIGDRNFTTSQAFYNAAFEKKKARSVVKILNL